MKVECYFKEKPPSVDWYRGAIPVKTDPRVVITYDEAKMYASMEMKKCKITDESKYRVQVEDAEGEETLEFAGFSVFVKGTGTCFCRNLFPFDFTNKHRVFTVQIKRGV